MCAHHLTSVAEQDVLDIWLYIARDNITAADALIDRLTETYELLSKHPQMGEAVEQYRPGLRFFPVGSYVIYYRVLSNSIEVYRVLHAARHRDDLL